MNRRFNAIVSIGLFLGLVVVLQLFSSCAYVKYDDTGCSSDLIFMSSVDNMVAPGKPFTISEKNVYFLGVFAIKTSNVNELLEKGHFTGKNISGLSLNTKFTGMDLILTAMTLGFISIKTISIEGRAVD